MKRDHQLRIALRHSQMQDIEFIAEAWSEACGGSISPSTAAWAMLSEYLSKARRESMRTPELNLVIAASKQNLRTFERVNDPKRPEGT